MPLLPATSVDFFLSGLESFMRRSGQGSHWGVTQLRLSGRPDKHALTRAWEQIHSCHPMLGARLRRQWRGWQWVWETPSQPIPAPAIHWHPAQTAPPDSAAIRLRLLGRTESSQLTTPLWIEVFPWGPENDHVILLTWRHSLLDGTGINLLLEKLAAGSCACPPPPAAPAKRESFASLYGKAKPLIGRLHAMTSAGCLSAWSRGMHQGGPPAYRLIEFSDQESQQATARLRSLCGDFLHMPFHAAVAARALYLLHSLRGWISPEIHLHLPVQIRGRSRDLIFGNHMGSLPLFLDSSSLTTMDQSVAHILKKYRESTRKNVPQASEALMTLASHMPVGAFIPAVRLTNRGQICSLFHSHTGTFLPGRSDFAGAALQNICTIPSVCTPPGLGVFASDYAGRFTVTLAWRENGISQDELNAVEQQIRIDMTGGQ